MAEQTEQSSYARFKSQVSHIEFLVQRRLTGYRQVLRGGAALFAASGEVSWEVWRRYVEALDLSRHFPGIQGMGVVLRLRTGELADQGEAIRAGGSPQHPLWADGERVEHAAMVYLEPVDGRAWGYDVLSEPLHREAMMRARDTGLPSASGKVRLVEETNQDTESGFVVFVPVYRQGVPLSDMKTRRTALIGYVYAPFRMDDLMRGIPGYAPQPEILLSIYDGTVDAARLLYGSPDPSAHPGGSRASFSIDKRLDVDGREWVLHFASSPAFDAGIDRQMERLFLIGALILSILFAALVWSALLGRQRSRQVALANSNLQDEVSEGVALAGKLARARDAAEAANAAKSAFLASVSHELRTPLTLILAPLEGLLAGQALPDVCRGQLQRVQRNALVLLNRVNDLLDYAKAEAGKFEVRWERFDLASVLGPIADDAALVAERKGCTLDWRVGEGLAEVCLDRIHFEKIVLNLVDNALKFTSPDGSIRIEARGVDDLRFRLDVADTGIGIPADKQAFLFTRFQQLDGSATRRYGGTGIGLALVKELAELMGGRVGVVSIAGEGARFWVELPRSGERPGEAIQTPQRETLVSNAATLRRTRFAASGASPAGAATVANAPSRRTRARVLVADDNGDMREYLTSLLGEEYRVVQAADGAQAWRLLQEQAIDVVVSDVTMSKVDGIELTRRIKTSIGLCHLPVVLVTARGSPEACVLGLEGGADDCLAKPFSPHELCARVRAALHLAEMQRQLRENARQAGMADVAAGVLHNLGNALAGVTLSSGIIEEKLRHSRVGKLKRLAQLLSGRQEDGAAIGSEADPALSTFADALSEHLMRERDSLLDEVAALRRCAAHAAGVVAAQQRFAKSAEVLRERIAADDLMEMAVELSHGAADLTGIDVARDFAGSAAVETDRHLALQILINLLANARQALRRIPNPTIWIRTSLAGAHVRLEVRDNGVGIEPSHLPLVFIQGFTTRDDGNGQGLHSSAVWARELGGSLTGHSDGLGRGACFVLELPAAASGQAAAAVFPQSVMKPASTVTPNGDCHVLH